MSDATTGIDRREAGGTKGEVGRKELANDTKVRRYEVKKAPMERWEHNAEEMNVGDGISEYQPFD